MTTWHPLLTAHEVEVAVWHLTGQAGEYAIVRLIAIGDERGYRATTFDEPRELVGYYRSLMAACAAAHRHYIRSHGPDPSTVGYPNQTQRSHPSGD